MGRKKKKVYSMDESGMREARKDNLQKLLKNCKITEAGLNLIADDPNLSETTVRKMVNTDKEYLDAEMRQTIATGAAILRASNEMLLGNRETGYACLKSCIIEDLEQTMAELVARFVRDKQIPYIFAAILIRDFYRRRGFEYSSRFSEYGTRKSVKWMPTGVSNVQMDAIETVAGCRVMPPV